jgi:hypothetical protein
MDLKAMSIINSTLVSAKPEPESLLFSQNYFNIIADDDETVISARPGDVPPKLCAVTRRLSHFNALLLLLLLLLKN